MKNQLITFAFAFVISACGNNVSKNEHYIKIKDENFAKIENAINENDTLAYSKVAAFLQLHNFNKELFYYAMGMANKNNYP